MPCFVLATVTLIYGCRKETQSNGDSVQLNDAKIAKAKLWYQSAYPKLKQPLISVKTNGITTADPDFSQYMQPDWEHPANYTRFDKDIIEMPLDPAVSIAFNLKNIAANKLAYKKEYSRSSFLLLNDGSSYKAYVMTIIADSAYLGNDLSKLNHNSYSKRDSDFSGLVLYFTPNGKYVSGWAYKKGKIVQPSASGTGQPGGTKVQSVTHAAQSCLDWYLVTYENGEPISETYLYTTCEGDGDGSSGGGSAPPSNCPPSGGGNTNSVKAGGPATNGTPPTTPPPSTPGDGGGFPPPDTAPCVVQVPPADTTNFCNNLTSAQKSTIINTLKQLRTDNCASKYLYDKLVQSTSGLTFCISAGSGSANYDPVNKSISFTTDYAASRVDILEHEMFHGYQDTFYPNGTASYGKNASTGVASPGFSNIEFEQAVFSDILNNSTTAFDKGTNAQVDAYQIWLNSITNNFSSYPKLTPGTSSYDSFINQYNFFLNQFNNLPNNSYSGPIIALNPSALITLFNLSNCN